MTSAHSPQASQLRSKHGEIYLIVAPPRTASTALARVFWEHPSIGFYCHEPFDRCYHQAAGIEDAFKMLHAPLDLRSTQRPDRSDLALIVKEMTFQVGEHFASLAALTTAPVVFLLRDPRLAIASRMRKRRAGGQSEVFPLNETGWEALESQVSFCRNEGIDFVLLDSSDLRNRSEHTTRRLFERLGLSFSPRYVSWGPAPKVTLGSLGAEQSHWYERVLTSRRLEPATSSPPEIREFPEDHGFREHVTECLAIYRKLMEDAHRIC